MQGVHTAEAVIDNGPGHRAGQLRQNVRVSPYAVPAEAAGTRPRFHGHRCGRSLDGEVSGGYGWCRHPGDRPAADILRALRQAEGALSQAEVAERVGLARSTVHRLLNALEDEGLVESGGPRGRYRLGPEVGRLADTARRGLIASIHPLLEELSHDVSETVDLSILDRDRATYSWTRSSRRTGSARSVRSARPSCCTAPRTGRLSWPACQRRISRGRRRGKCPGSPRVRSPTRRPCSKSLDEVRAEGVAYDREENSEGICAVGMVLRGLSGAALAVSVPLPAAWLPTAASRCSATRCSAGESRWNVSGWPGRERSGPAVIRA